MSIITSKLTKNKRWSWKLYATMVWMQSETSTHSGHRNDDCMHAVPANWGALKCKPLCLDSMTGDCRHALLWQSIVLGKVDYSELELSSFSLLKILSRKEIGSHNLFSDMSFGCPNIYLVRIQLSLQWKHWVLRLHSVSAIHGERELRAILQSQWSECVFWDSHAPGSPDRSLTSWSYSRIGKHRSKHTT
jgi:hypothetical protein